MPTAARIRSLGLIAVAFIIACAGPTRSPTAPEGTRIAVQEFETTQETVIERYSATGESAGMRFAELLAARLKKMGYEAVAVPRGVPLEGDLRVSGYMAEIDGGSAAKRIIWGMGTGAAQFDVYGSVTRVDGSLVGEFTESRRSNKGYTEQGALDRAMLRTINMIAPMIYTGRYRKNAPQHSRAAQQFKSSASVATTAVVTAPSAEDRLRSLDRLRADGIVAPEEYEAKRREILRDL